MRPQTRRARKRAEAHTATIATTRRAGGGAKRGSETTRVGDGTLAGQPGAPVVERVLLSRGRAPSPSGCHTSAPPTYRHLRSTYLPPHLPPPRAPPRQTSPTTAPTLYFSCHAACSGSVMSTATSECGLAGAPAARGKKSAMERCAPPRCAVATRAPRRRRTCAGAATAREPSSSSKRDGGSAGRQGQGQGGAGERDLRSQAGRNGRVAPARRGSGCCNVTAQAAATHSAGR